MGILQHNFAFQELLLGQKIITLTITHRHYFKAKSTKNIFAYTWSNNTNIQNGDSLEIKGKITQWAVFSTFLTCHQMSSNVKRLKASVISFIFVNPSVVFGERRRKNYIKGEIFLPDWSPGPCRPPGPGRRLCSRWRRPRWEWRCPWRGSAGEESHTLEFSCRYDESLNELLLVDIKVRLKLWSRNKKKLTFV